VQTQKKGTAKKAGWQSIHEDSSSLNFSFFPPFRLISSLTNLTTDHDTTHSFV
jgi:hypothetical protein